MWIRASSGVQVNNKMSYFPSMWGSIVWNFTFLLCFHCGSTFKVNAICFTLHPINPTLNGPKEEPFRKKLWVQKKMLVISSFLIFPQCLSFIYKYYHLTFLQASPGVTCLPYKSFENTLGKEEFAHKQQFLLFPPCFLPFWITFCNFHHN